MRKIENLMNAAIEAGEDFKLGNTEVVACSNVSDVFLHGNLIARVGETWIELYDAGYQTATTKSRLNAILAAHGVGNERVYQSGGVWYLQQWDGSSVPFFNGMRLN